MDVNLPPITAEAEMQAWLNEIDETMLDLVKKGYGNPCPANAIFFCNDPSHFITNRPLQDDTDHLWIKYYTSDLPKVSHPSTDIVGRLMKAYTQRVSSPEEIDFS